MKKSPWAIFLFLILIFGSICAYFISKSVSGVFEESQFSAFSSKNHILHLELNGVIMDGKKVLEPLIKYRKRDKIKAIVLEINSPGGVVGPSQELYAEIKRTREEFKKPVVVVSTGLMASGGYYAAVAADKIIVAPGTLMGSIGVIMEFLNLERLYDWAKVSRYSINTGKYKDSGAEYRPMRPDERELFQDLVDDVYLQFVQAVAEGRKMDVEEVKKWADGRVFTGRQGKELGFADELGMLEDGYSIAGELAGVGKDFEIVRPPSARPSLWDLVAHRDEDDGTAEWKGGDVSGAIEKSVRKALKADLMAKPLYLMPGVL